MAEVYGVKPKMFTKEWWPYFWLYYKWHTIAILFVGSLIVFGVTDCITKERYDLQVTYYGNVYQSAEAWDAVGAALEIDINDVDENDEKNISIMPLTVSEGNEYVEQNYAMNVKYTTSFSEELSYLYIYDKTQLEIAQEQGMIKEVFVPVNDWVDGELAENRLVYEDNEKAYAVSLKGSKLLADAGIISDDLYVAVKGDIQASKGNTAVYENAVIAANNLIR